VDTEWDIRQNYNALEGSYIIEWPGSWWVLESTRCDFKSAMGGIGGTEFTVSSSGCNENEFLMECADGTSRELALTNITWESRLQGDQTIYGEWTGNLNCFDAQTGQELGVFTLTGDTYLVPL
jgi:hypothetical protein